MFQVGEGHLAIAEPCSFAQIVVEPDQCRVIERLHLEMDFSLDAPLEHAHWEVKVSHTSR
jgi:hypothetical protein